MYLFLLGCSWQIQKLKVQEKWENCAIDRIFVTFNKKGDIYVSITDPDA